jgi:hypothetical protein
MSDCVCSTSSAIIALSISSGGGFAFRLDRLIVPERRSTCSIASPCARVSLGVHSWSLIAAAGERLFRASGSPSPPSSTRSWDFHFRVVLAPFELTRGFVDDPSRRLPSLLSERCLIMLGCMMKPALTCHCDFAEISFTVWKVGSNAT